MKRIQDSSISQEVKKLAEKFGYLPYMTERYLRFLGKEETERLLRANEQPPKTTIRVNTLKISPEKLRKRLERKGFILREIKWIPYGYEIKKEGTNLGSTHEYLQGYFHLQGLASMLGPQILKPKPNEMIIDMAAAPGSKSTQLAQLMRNQGKLLLIEKNKKRIPSLQVNVRRLGIKNALILLMDSQKLGRLGIKSDKILLDAPCTGEGLIREDPSRKKSRTLNDINEMARVQKNLLKAGLNSLKSNGLLLYSTCSIAPEEDELVIDSILKDNAQFTIEELPNKFGVDGYTEVFDTQLRKDLKNSKRLYPHIHDTIGFFLCLIRKM
jgi:NOL1/NOP2/sun family putative RNA methylase